MDSFSNFVEIQKLKKELSAKSGNLVRYVVSHVAETDGQTLFPIELSTFNFRTDSVWVVSGRTMLSATRDYVVQSQSIVLNEGVPAGRTVDIYVYKNVENPDAEKVIDGRQIGVGTIPIDRIDGNVGGKMKMYTHTQTATVDNQTEFDILIDSFDKDEDAIKVYVGMLTLHRDVDFTISDLNKIVLNEGVNVGETITTDIFKQVEQTGEETLISGLAIEKGSIPLDKLAELPVPISAGGTGATTAEDALDNLLDGNVKVKGSNYSCVVVLNESSGRRQGFQVVGDDIYLWNQKDASNLTSLFLYGEDNSNYLTLRVKKDDVDNYYKIFGEHNTDLLATQIQTLLQGGKVSMVKGVQRGVISISANDTSKTATINAVNTSKAVVLFGGYDTDATSSNGAQPKYNHLKLVLTNSTTVTASRTASGHTNLTIPYQVVEYY